MFPGLGKLYPKQCIYSLKTQSLEFEGKNPTKTTKTKTKPGLGNGSFARWRDERAGLGGRDAVPEESAARL